jgi:alkyl hydroperoxide reductase subunit AhpC
LSDFYQEITILLRNIFEAWTKTPRKQGGLGSVDVPLLSDLTHQISKDYGVYLEHLGHSLRGLFIIGKQKETLLFC